MNQRVYGFLRIIPGMAIFIFTWSFCFPGIAQPSMPRASSVWALPFSEPFTISQGFAPPDKPWLSGSRGIWVKVGSEDPSLRSPCNGTVVFAGMLAGREVLSIDCGGIHSTFEPATSSLRIGEAVQRGQRIGEIAPHKQEDSQMRRGDLHWGAKVSRYRYINPLRMLQGHPRLKTLQ